MQPKKSQRSEGLYPPRVDAINAQSRSRSPSPSPMSSSSIEQAIKLQCFYERRDYSNQSRIRRFLRWLRRIVRNLIKIVKSSLKPNQNFDLSKFLIDE